MAIRHISNIAGYKFGGWRAVARVPLPFAAIVLQKSLTAPGGSIASLWYSHRSTPKERQNQCPQH
jgi:hypothetical protein